MNIVKVDRLDPDVIIRTERFDTVDIHYFKNGNLEAVPVMNNIELPFQEEDRVLCKIGKLQGRGGFVEEIDKYNGLILVNFSNEIGYADDAKWVEPDNLVNITEKNRRAGGKSL